MPSISTRLLLFCFAVAAIAALVTTLLSSDIINIKNNSNNSNNSHKNSSCSSTEKMSASGVVAPGIVQIDNDEVLQQWRATLAGKHILVAGGAGYIGSHTVVELLLAAASVTVVDNLCNSNIEGLKRVEQITGKSLIFIEADLTDYHSLNNLVFVAPAAAAAGIHYDSVIHFASLKAVGDSMLRPLQYHSNNLIATLNLLRCMEEHNVHNLVFSSSATVYGNASSNPITEHFPLGSTNPYGQTKYIIELILRDLATAAATAAAAAAASGISSSSKPWRFVLLRYFNPIGAHPSGLIGEDPLGVPANLVPFVAQVAAGRADRAAAVSVFGSDYNTIDGSGVRDYIHIVDLARGHVAALADGIYGGSGSSSSSSSSSSRGMQSNCEAYNLGSGTGYSVLQVIAAYSKSAGKQVPFVLSARRAGDVAECYADTNKAQQQLRWQATHTLQQACDSSWKWQSENPNGFNVAVAAAAVVQQ